MIPNTRELPRSVLKFGESSPEFSKRLVDSFLLGFRSETDDAKKEQTVLMCEAIEEFERSALAPPWEYPNVAIEDGVASGYMDAIISVLARIESNRRLIDLNFPVTVLEARLQRVMGDGSFDPKKDHLAVHDAMKKCVQQYRTKDDPDYRQILELALIYCQSRILRESALRLLYD